MQERIDFVRCNNERNSGLSPSNRPVPAVTGCSIEYGNALLLSRPNMLDTLKRAESMLLSALLIHESQVSFQPI